MVLYYFRQEVREEGFVLDSVNRRSLGGKHSVRLLWPDTIGCSSRGQPFLRNMEADSLVLSDAVCNLVCRIRADAYLLDCSQRLSKEWADIIRDEKSAPFSMQAQRHAATEYHR